MVSSCAAALLLALLAVAHATPISRLPNDLDQLVYSPRGIVGKDLKRPFRRFWDRSVLEQANIVENFGQMKPLLDKLNAGQPITVVSMGDSISAAYGGCFHRDKEHRKRYVSLVDPMLTGDQCSFDNWRWLTSFMQQINTTWPHYDHVLINLAKPGSCLMTFSEGECLEEFFPRQADLVIIEHLSVMEAVNTTVKEAERLLHRLWLHMQAPLPAVIFLSMHALLNPDGSWDAGSTQQRCVKNITLCPTECPTLFVSQPDPKLLFSEPELHTHAVASYYGLTSLSHPALLHTLMRDRLPQNMLELSECEAFGLIYSDVVHPDIHGRVLLADLLVNFLAMAQRHLEALEAAQIPSGGAWTRSLPARPIEPDSVTLYRSHCLYSAMRVHDDTEAGDAANLHTMHMLKTEGWQFVKYDGEAKKYKPGWVANTPGSTLWIDIPLSLVTDASVSQGRRLTLQDEVPERVSERQVAPVQDFQWHLRKVARKLGAPAVTPTHAADMAWVRQVRPAELDEAEVTAETMSAAHPRRALSSGPDIYFHLHVVFLRSYRHMGKAKLTCLNGCQCTHDFNGYHAGYQTSIPEIARIMVHAPDRTAASCILEVKVLPETDSGEHKVKVIQMALGIYLNMTDQILNVARASRHVSS